MNVFVPKSNPISVILSKPKQTDQIACLYIAITAA